MTDKHPLNSQENSYNHPFLNGGGEMGALTRALNWSKTILGTPETWPQSLRTTLSIILNSKFPMFLFWGPQHLCFYNDAYRPSLGNEGKHPHALGQPGSLVWPEIWAFIKPLIDQVLSGQGATWNEDQLLPIYRNGQMEDVYWTFSYSQVSDESGNPAGVFVTCSETTQAVIGRRALQLNQERFYNLMTNAPVAIALFRGPEFVIELANDQVLEYWGRQREAVMNKPLFEALPEASGQGFEELLTSVYTTGERFVAKELVVDLEREGRLAPTYIDFVYEPYRETDGTITGIIVVCVEITDQVLARREIEESESRFRKLIMQAPMGICVLNAADLVSEIVNDSFLEVAGKPYGDIIGKNYWIPFAKAEPYYGVALQGVVNEGKTFYANEVELALIRQGKEEIIYVTFVYAPLKDDQDQVQKVVVWVIENTYQVTERRKIEELVAERTAELAAALEELSASNEELAAHNEEYAAINEELTASSEDAEKANRDLEEVNQHLTRSNQNLEQFAYIASHDLQEPLRKIQQFGDLLRTRNIANLSTESLSYLDRMQSAASRMSLLIKDLLAFSRISTSPAVTAPVSLGKIVTEALDNLSVVLEETKAKVEVNKLPTLQGDRSQLGQLFLNLLSNALKFSRRDASGRPVVPLICISYQEIQAAALPPSLTSIRSAESYHLIKVIDNGIGFEEKYSERIFQVFQRLHGKSEFAGTGVGLAIVEKVVINHGGTITATSKLGEGATFSVYLPI